VNDDERLARWRDGDAEAADALFERHFDGLYRFFRNKAPASADDLVQRTLLACFEGRDRFRGDCSFRTYLFAVARNQLLGHIQRERSGARVEPERDSVADSAPSPSSVLQHRHEQEVVLHALRRIPIDHQILLELFYWEQQSGAELAVILGVPEGTIRTRLRRARQLLADQVQAVARDPELVQSTLSGLDDWARQVAAGPTKKNSRGSAIDSARGLTTDSNDDA
jgi:RNA polymerase sigma-70 factor (ECF subfamily)